MLHEGLEDDGNVSERYTQRRRAGGEVGLAACERLCTGSRTPLPNVSREGFQQGHSEKLLEQSRYGPKDKAASTLLECMPQFTEEDEGKTVVNPVGEKVGIIELVKNGTAYVDPHPSWSDRIKAHIGWEDTPDMSEQPLEDDFVEEITDDQVILRQDLQIDRNR